MRPLLYKELRLAAHPTLYLFLWMGALLLVPAYPYGVVFFFGMLALFFTFQFSRENRDGEYTVLLPLRKADVVKGKCLLAGFVQLGLLLLSVPFALMGPWVHPQGNPVGLEANVAYYGFGLLIFAVFNGVFFPQFYRTGYRVERAFLLAVIPAGLCIVAMEALAHVPALAWLDGVEPADLVRQLPLLLVGAAVYGVGMVCTYRTAARRFEGVDL